MDDSDQDFVALCSKLLKRVRKKPGEPRQPSNPENHPSSQPCEGDRRRRKHSESVSKVIGTHPTDARVEKRLVTRGTVHDSGDAGSSAAAGSGAERGLTAKDRVLEKMQQFKRASPQRMVHTEESQPTNDCQPQIQENPKCFSSGLHPEPQDSDEALALKLQQDLDREAAEAQVVDLEDGGLFFCQICHKDLSHMTPEGRTQHLNRCLDESEENALGPPLHPIGVPNCPICGKNLKSQKSRFSHLKRCSSDMGISPSVLLQTLQRQAEEMQNVPTANAIAQTGGTKRKGLSKPGLQAKKKSRKKMDPLDEDTMVALALSSSLLEREREQQKERDSERQLQVIPVLEWRPDIAKGWGKRKRGAMPRPPALLLVQDAQEALTRLQERVSALLLRSWPPFPPTPTRCPSTLPDWTGAAPLWQKSKLLNRGSNNQSDFYSPELRQFITPWESAKTHAAFTKETELSLQPLSEGTPVTETMASILPSSSQRSVPCSSDSCTSGTRQLPVGSQALQDLMELAEDGMTLTQCGYTASDPDKDQQNSGKLSTNLHLSGFVLEEPEEPADLCVSGFLPETAHTDSEDPHSQGRMKTDQPGTDKKQGSHQLVRSAEFVALSKLASDLSSMVNNPQLSDLQLQVDSGDVYFAHSFMVYTRCPLLAEMVHESGFGVQEEGMPAAQRVLMSDIPGQAVFALLQYLYTANCSFTASLQPHVLELASRFDLHELQQLCEQHQEGTDYASKEENVTNQTDQAFMELLRSMWNEEDEGDAETDTDGGRDKKRVLEKDRLVNEEFTSSDREIHEEKVNEEELEEIYEFAATQKKREEDDYSNEEKVDESKESSSEKSLKLKSQLEPDLSLDRSYSRLFSESWGVHEEEDPSSLPSTSDLLKTCPTQSQQHQSSHKPPAKLSSRTLLQSSASVLDDFSLSPLSNTPKLPIPGLSPGQVGRDVGTNTVKVDECLPLKRESQGPHSICVPFSPDLPQNKKNKTETELIVLSDSSEEMEVVLSSRSPSPPSPYAVQNPQNYTEVKSQQMQKLNETTFENKESSRLECNSGDPVHCSPEVSWLIPSTPVQPERSTRTSSTQTKSRMCRTQLFPKDDTLSPLSVLFPSGSSGSRLKTSNSPTRDTAHVGTTEGSVSRVKVDRIIHTSSGLDLNLYDMSKDREPKVSQLSCSTDSHPMQSSLKQETPLHLQHQPYCSTPLQTEFQQPLGHIAATLPHTDPNKNTGQGRERVTSESPVKLGSFKLSPLSDPSDLPSSSSHRGCQSSQTLSRFSNESRRSVESSGYDDAGNELKRRIGGDAVEVRNESVQDLDSEKEQDEVKEQSGEAEVAEHSFQQSFMDEPPIAFNDSWGLDPCIEENPGCFSLRLQDSGGSSQQERSLGEGETLRSSLTINGQPPPPSHCIQSLKSHVSMINTSPSKAHSTQPLSGIQVHTSPSSTLPPPDTTNKTTPDKDLLDSKIWDSWEDEGAEQALPLSQRVNPSAQLKTPTSSHNKKRKSLVPITPMPHYSDMDTPELKNKLNRFGVRPLPKRQMILKLKEIHHYTHQLVSSDSEDEALPAGRTAQTKTHVTSTAAASSKPVSCTQHVRFKEPRVPAAISPVKHNREEEEGEPLSASQGSNTSSTAASEESERSNPELCLSSTSDSDSDGGISASQVANRLQDRLRAVRSFILSDPTLYSQILHYQPLVLSHLQERLRAAGIRLGAAKLVDYLDSQCVTFTTAKPGQSAPSRRHGKRTSKAVGEGGVRRKKGVTAKI
ncbi:Structure-specific endonuclease subunit SLX4 BTB/POZ domain-containing protein 12 [Channa argus]|uniref:Structure-specific endonuclease subunit SLX4 n=1 Tax=Channa argus TaxID=215402 RepID=A0A6G1PAX3_CHAAH|nr:Structure-specific endonuclease subunit SLX4 BTB/POZ domain-containing protein 12 [Channa argus]